MSEIKCHPLKEEPLDSVDIEDVVIADSDLEESLESASEDSTPANNSVQSNKIVYVPMMPPMSDIPNLISDSGKYEFHVKMESRDVFMKSPNWLMSKVTKKLYTHINRVVPFHLEIKKAVPKNGMSIRVMGVFNNHHDLANIVHRCPNHASLNDPTNIDFQHVHHVIRVDHPSAVYEESASGRLSVYVPLLLNYDGSIAVSPLRLRFMCLCSCPGGINRRPFAVMIVLEHYGQDVGRHIIDVRVCACPVRDFKMDESGAYRKWKKGKRLLYQEVRGKKLFNFLKSIKEAYLAQHPEYLKEYPDFNLQDIKDFFQGGFLPSQESGASSDSQDSTNNDNDDFLSPLVIADNCIHVSSPNKDTASQQDEGHEPYLRVGNALFKLDDTVLKHLLRTQKEKSAVYCGTIRVNSNNSLYIDSLISTSHKRNLNDVPASLMSKYIKLEKDIDFENVPLKHKSHLQVFRGNSPKIAFHTVCSRKEHVSTTPSPKIVEREKELIAVNALTSLGNS